MITWIRRGLWRLRGFLYMAPAAVTLTAVCVFIFIIQQTTAGVEFVSVYGYRFNYDQALLSCFGLNWPLLKQGFLWQFLTYMFLHGSWLHLGLNMLTVLFFGSGLEVEVGKRYFWRIFLTGGFLGGLGWLVFTALVAFVPATSVLVGWMPQGLQDLVGAGSTAGRSLDHSLCIGASGGVFGLIGAYAALFPTREVYVLLIFFPLKMRARTLAWVLGVLTVLDAVFVQSQVAYAAHLAGGVAGYLTGCHLRRTGCSG